MTSARRRRADYRRWHRLQVATGDLDPAYPVLRELSDLADLTPDQRAWLVLLHVAYYHLGSALAAFARHRFPEELSPGDPALYLPCGTERRGHRARPKLLAHLNGLAASVGPHPADWIDPDGRTATDRWRTLTERVAAVPGNGRWAAYKTCEMAQKVCGAQVAAPDAGHAYSTGPRRGLALLHPIPVGNDPATIARLDRLTADLADELGEPDVAQVETSLCDFHSLSSGRYYLGHDIDVMQAQLSAVPSPLTGTALAARWRTLPVAYLGEHGGWHGPDRLRKRVYAEHGSIVERFITSLCVTADR